MVPARDQSVPMLYAEKGVHPAEGGTVLPPQGEVDLSCTCVFCGPAPYVPPNIKCSRKISISNIVTGFFCRPSNNIQY